MGDFDPDAWKREMRRLAHKFIEHVRCREGSTAVQSADYTDDLEDIGCRLAEYVVGLDDKLTNGESVLPLDWQNEGTLGDCTE